MRSIEHTARVIADGKTLLPIFKAASFTAHEAEFSIDGAGISGYAMDHDHVYAAFVNRPASDLDVCQAGGAEHKFGIYTERAMGFLKENHKGKVELLVTDGAVFMKAEDSLMDVSSRNEPLPHRAIEMRSTVSFTVGAKDLLRATRDAYAAMSGTSYGRNIHLNMAGGRLAIVEEKEMTAMVSMDIGADGEGAVTMKGDVLETVLFAAGDASVRISWGPDTAPAFEWDGVRFRIAPIVPDSGEPTEPNELHIDDNPPLLISMDIGDCQEFLGIGARHVEELPFIVDAEGLHYCVMDQTHVSMVKADIPAKAFGTFLVPEEPAKATLRTSGFLKAVKRIKGPVTLGISGGSVFLRSDTHTFIVGHKNITHERRHPLPKIDAAGEAVADSRTVMDVLKKIEPRKCNQVWKTQDARVEIGSGLAIVHAGTDETAYDVPAETTGSGSCAYYAMFLKKAFESATGDARITVSKQSPLMVQWDHVTYWLAKSQK